MAATQEQQQQFIKTYLPYAQKASAAISIPYQTILAQWGNETGWGTHFANSFNIGNVKNTANVPINFSSVESGVQGYIDFFLHDSAGYYSEARKHADDPKASAEALMLSPYAGSHYGYSGLFDALNSVYSLLPHSLNTAQILSEGIPSGDFNPINVTEGLNTQVSNKKSGTYILNGSRPDYAVPGAGPSPLNGATVNEKYAPKATDWFGWLQQWGKSIMLVLVGIALFAVGSTITAKSIEREDEKNAG